MDHSQIENLARGPKESLNDLDARVVSLKSSGAGILECILYVKINQGCSLTQASDFVINSSAWASQKEAFLQHQSDMFEQFLHDNSDKIEAIHQTITPDETVVVAHLKQDRS
jgi:hypothetical protein